MTTPLVRSARRAHCWLNVRKLSPMRVPPAQSLTASATRARARSRSRSLSSRVTRVSRVPNTNDSVRTSLAALSAWTNRSSRREWRSMDPLMSQMTTSERGSLTGRRQTHVHQLAAGPQVSPEHRPRRQAATVGMELVATRSPLLQARHQQVDQSLRLPQLRRGHPVELAVAKHLAARVGIGRHDDALDVAVVLGVLVAGGWHRDPALLRTCRRSAHRRAGAVPRRSTLRPRVHRRPRAVEGAVPRSHPADAPRCRHHRSKTAS